MLCCDCFPFLNTRVLLQGHHKLGGRLVVGWPRDAQGSESLDKRQVCQEAFPADGMQRKAQERLIGRCQGPKNGFGSVVRIVVWRLLVEKETQRAERPVRCHCRLQCARFASLQSFAQQWCLERLDATVLDKMDE